MTDSGRTFLELQASILDGISKADDGMDGEKLAWMVRVVQIQNRERAPQVMGKSVGADELVPLLEEVLVRRAHHALDCSFYFFEDLLLATE